MGKIIVVTGAGDGLGRTLARRFAKDGDTVIMLGLTGSKVESLAAELGEPHWGIPCDVRDPDAVQSAFRAIASRFPRIDVLINNAGVFEPFTLAQATPAQVRRHMDTNLAGPVYCAHEALPLLRGEGHIINVTSDAISLKIPMMWMYAGTKSALEFMSEIWARELAPDGVRVTVVRCGHMRDETKTSWGWDREITKQFLVESAKAGINVRERGTSHYTSVAAIFRSVIDAPGDIHCEMIQIIPRKI